MSSACSPYLDAILELDQYTKDGIIFWKENIDFVKSRFCFMDRKPHVFGFSNASASGCGAGICFGIPARPPKVRLGGNSPP